MASSPLGSLPPVNSPTLISPPPLEAVVGSSSQPPLSQLPPPSVSAPAPPIPAPSSAAVSPPATTPVAPPALPLPTPESSPPAPPTAPPVSSEAPPLLASQPSTAPLPQSLPASQPSPPPPTLPASQPSSSSPPPTNLATTPSPPVIIITPVTSPLPPQPLLLSPPPPVIPSLPLSSSPPPPPSLLLPPSSPVSLPPLQTLPKPFFPSPSVTASLPPLPSPGDQHAFTAVAPLPSVPWPSRGSPPVALPLVTSANLTAAGARQQQVLPAGLIVGCLVGGVALFLVLALLGAILYRRSKKRNEEPKLSGIGGADLSPAAQHSQQSTPTDGSHVINVGTQATPPLTGPAAAAVSCSANVSLAEKYPTNGLTYEDLAVATDGFSEENLVGEGGFGYVHKGILSNGKEVAVKQLREGRKQGEKEFQAEVEIISRIHHKHLVSLLGYCIHGAKRLLVYEFVPNDTLEFHLHGNGRPVMEWGVRLRIAVGSAKGLAYLHDDCDPKILHRDIKASNILVDLNFEAKVSDFGLARSYNADASVTHISTQVVGTFGYLAPEYASSGKVTEKSDVYSYGVVLLELITGRPPICFSESISRTSLVEWARPLLTKAVETRNFQSLVDPRLGTNYDNSEMTRMVSCAAACVRHSAWLRPRMSQVVHALEGDARAVMNLDKGNKVGRSASYGYSPWKGSNYCSAQYKEDMKRFNIVLTSDHSGMTSDTTSERRL
ncbi:unnamed protein product [Linum trigynum]|uniref:non-specific serine/threonine protein kinase n=1 Tax=Linum trigynum TaxID=586398 RepID=A0AAV2DHS1_9ROSI